MDRQRVVQSGLDPAIAQKSPQRIPLLRQDHIQMIDVVRINHSRQGQRQAGKSGVVVTSDGSTLISPGIKPGQLVAENDPLNPLHAIIETQFAVGVPFGLGMISQYPDPVGKEGVVGGDETSFARGAEVLPGIETEASE